MTWQFSQCDPTSSAPTSHYFKLTVARLNTHTRTHTHTSLAMATQEEYPAVLPWTFLHSSAVNGIWRLEIHSWFVQRQVCMCVREHSRPSNTHTHTHMHKLLWSAMGTMNAARAQHQIDIMITICTHIDTLYINTYIDTSIVTYIHIPTYIHYTQTCTQLHRYVHSYTHIYAHVYTVHTYIHTYIHTIVTCIHIQTYIHSTQICTQILYIVTYTYICTHVQTLPLDANLCRPRLCSWSRRQCSRSFATCPHQRHFLHERKKKRIV